MATACIEITYYGRIIIDTKVHTRMNDIMQMLDNNPLFQHFGLEGYVILEVNSRTLLICVPLIILHFRQKDRSGKHKGITASFS
jgi:hypothetical protein